MDNTLVSARVSRAKKERAQSILASIGASASDLINSAYDYVIATKQLPNAQEVTKGRNAQGFEAFVRDSTLEIDWSRGPVEDYKAFMKDARVSDYESLA